MCISRVLLSFGMFFISMWLLVSNVVSMLLIIVFWLIRVFCSLVCRVWVSWLVCWCWSVGLGVVFGCLGVCLFIGYF